MKPSQYLSNSFEEYYYDNYLVRILQKYGLVIPEKDIYVKQIHSTSPKCVEDLQILYYKGCKTSSKYTGNQTDILFYNELKNESNNCIEKFIEITELDIIKLSHYLQKSQDKKVYLLYKNGNFNVQIENDDYILESYVKTKNSYIATTKSGKKIKILLRWKNGNGIAYPAFQIS